MKKSFLYSLGSISIISISSIPIISCAKSSEENDKKSSEDKVFSTNIKKINEIIAKIKVLDIKLNSNVDTSNDEKTLEAIKTQLQVDNSSLTNDDLAKITDNISSLNLGIKTQVILTIKVGEQSNKLEIYVTKTKNINKNQLNNLEINKIKNILKKIVLKNIIISNTSGSITDNKNEILSQIQNLDGYPLNLNGVKVSIKENDIKISVEGTPITLILSKGDISEEIPSLFTISRTKTQNELDEEKILKIIEKIKYKEIGFKDTIDTSTSEKILIAIKNQFKIDNPSLTNEELNLIIKHNDVLLNSNVRTQIPLRINVGSQDRIFNIYVTKSRNAQDFIKQKQLINLFTPDNNTLKIKLDDDILIADATILEEEIKKHLKIKYNLSDKELTYISIETPFSEFSIGNYKNINIGIKVGNEEKDKTINFKVLQFAKMIDLNINIQDIINRAIKARTLNIQNGATKEEEGYLNVPILEDGKNIIAIKVNANGEYTNSDFVQYDTLTSYENDKAKYTIDQNDDDKNNKKNERMLYNKNKKTPILVSLRKSYFEHSSEEDDDKIKNSFDYLRLAANLSTREILREIWIDIENYVSSNIDPSATTIISEIKKETNLNNTIRDSHYKKSSLYNNLNDEQKSKLDSLIKNIINPFIDQLSDQNIACVKRLILKLKLIPNYIKNKHNEIVNKLSSLLEDERIKKFKIYNLKFYKSWKNSDWVVNIPLYDDSKKVKYSRYKVNIVDQVPLIFDVEHEKYLNPIAYSIGKTFINLVENALVNMPLTKTLLKEANNVNPFEIFIKDFFNKFKNTNLLNAAKLDITSSENYNGTIINYIKKLLTNSFIFNEKFVKNFSLFDNTNLNAKEWYNFNLKNIINSFIPQAWDWLKKWENSTNKSFVNLLNAIKNDLDNNKNNRPFSLIKINVYFNDEAYSKKINLDSFFNKDLLSYKEFINLFETNDRIDDIKGKFGTKIETLINEEDLFNISIKSIWNSKIKPFIEEIQKKLEDNFDTWLGNPIWTLINASSVKEFMQKNVKPIIEEVFPILKDFSNIIFKVIKGESGIYDEIDIDYISSLILRIEWLINKYRMIGYLGYNLSLYIPDLTNSFKEINDEIRLEHPIIKIINNIFGPITR